MNDDNDFTLICGDCAEIMATMPDDYIDLTVTSPPYDNLRDYNGYSFNFETIAQQLYRITKPGGVVVWVVGDATINGSETGTSFRQALYFMEIGFNLHDTMIYQKMNGAIGSNTTYLQEFEYMFVLSKSTPATINLIRDRKNAYSARSTPKTKSTKHGKTPERRFFTPDEYGRRKNIWAYAVGGKQEIGYHPAVFPESLARDHILSWSNPGDLILDPMCGSGTTGKMAVKYERRFIGIDISAEYIALAEKRIAQARLQMRLGI